MEALLRFLVGRLSISGSQMRYGSQIWLLSTATKARNCPFPVLSCVISSGAAAAAGYIQVASTRALGQLSLGAEGETNDVIWLFSQEAQDPGAGTSPGTPAPTPS